MQFTFAPSPLANYSQWAFFEKAFTSEECEKIKALFDNPEIASIGNEQANTRNSDIRKSEICWIPYSSDTRWIYERISEFVFGCNNERYGFQLSGFGEALQLGRYTEGDHYTWHQDIGPGKMTTRKLSIVLQLSKPDEYEGGALEFQGFDEKVSNNQGDLIIFPSFNPHRVTKVTKGERYSLVAWLSGPTFR